MVNIHGNMFQMVPHGRINSISTMTWLVIHTLDIVPQNMLNWEHINFLMRTFCIVLVRCWRKMTNVGLIFWCLDFSGELYFSILTSFEVQRRPYFLSVASEQLLYLHSNLTCQKPHLVKLWCK